MRDKESPSAPLWAMREPAFRLRAVVLALWLVIFGIAHASAAVFHAPENRIRDFPNAGYDSVGRTSINYDGSTKSSFAYDAAPSRVQTNSENRTGRTRVSFASFDRLLAAKGLATGADEAVFWSGIGRGGDVKAANWVAQNGGATLETTMAARGIKLPTWDPNNPAVVAAWKQASTDFAAGARGNVRVLQGDSLRIDSIWKDEFRALQANPNVNSIRAVNPDTGAEMLLW